MKNYFPNQKLSRRQMLRLSAAGAAALGAQVAFPDLSAAAPVAGSASGNLYADLLQTWCDGLLAHQVSGLGDALDGGLLCPACVLIHGRCGDAVYPLLRVAHTTGNDKYVRAAIAVHEWSERQVSRADGSWINDVTLSSWQGITVFHSIALAEALHHHGEVLDARTRQAWTDRLARAAKFLDGFISIETGNINYPITASYAFSICGQVLGEPHYTARGRELAHTAMGYFTKNGLLFGEGHPLQQVSPKGCRPVDLGYNVEESLPALAMYATLTNDAQVLDQAVAALRAHMEFMLPDGAWDNSWGTRNYKWTWWGSRTSDGCQPAFVLLAAHDPRFREAAWRNLQLMSHCTHNGLLYGGPDYAAHGDLPCIHHSFTHAKALATVLDRGGADVVPAAHASLPRDEAYGLKSFPEIDTHLAAVGDWRATVTGYDWEYTEHVQAGSGGAGGGHATGGALSLLFHKRLGPVLAASMTEYQMVEISNQQAFRDSPHMPLTPRLESAADATYTSLSDLAAVVKATQSGGQVAFEATGRMLTAQHHTPPSGDVRYRLAYTASEAAVEIVARVEGAPQMPVKLILPIIARSDEAVTRVDAKTIRIAKSGGALTVRCDGAAFDPLPAERTFNLVPGFEAVPLTLPVRPGEEVRLRLEAS